MIYTPNTSLPEQIGSINERNFWEQFYFFYEPYAIDFSGTPPMTGTAYENLSSNIYGEYCAWNASSVIVNGNLGSKQTIEAIIFGNPSFTKVTGKFYDGNTEVFNFDRMEWITNNYVGIITPDIKKQIVFKRYPVGAGMPVSRQLAPGEHTLDVTDQGIIVLITNFYANRFEMTFTGGDTIKTMNGLYVGRRKSVVKGSGAAYPLIGTGEGKTDDLGHAYGVKWPTRRGFRYDWDVFDDTDRRVVERLLDTVQNVDPHYILPFSMDTDFIPPMFARLTTQELNNQRWKAAWFWEKPSLEWEVVR